MVCFDRFVLTMSVSLSTADEACTKTKEFDCVTSFQTKE